jgi:hypothetical protein
MHRLIDAVSDVLAPVESLSAKICVIHGERLLLLLLHGYPFDTPVPEPAIHNQRETSD